MIAPMGAKASVLPLATQTWGPRTTFGLEGISIHNVENSPLRADLKVRLLVLTPLPEAKKFRSQRFDLRFKRFEHTDGCQSHRVGCFFEPMAMTEHHRISTLALNHRDPNFLVVSFWLAFGLLQNGVALPLTNLFATLNLRRSLAQCPPAGVFPLRSHLLAQRIFLLLFAHSR